MDERRAAQCCFSVIKNVHLCFWRELVHIEGMRWNPWTSCWEVSLCFLLVHSLHWVWTQGIQIQTQTLLFPVDDESNRSERADHTQTAASSSSRILSSRTSHPCQTGRDWTLSSSSSSRSSSSLCVDLFHLLSVCADLWPAGLRTELCKRSFNV